MRKIVMLYGVSCAGKDTVANFLVKERGYVRLAFADVLKEYCSGKYNLPLNIFHTQQGKSSVYRHGITIRKLLINEAFEQRSLYPDTFVDFIIKKIKLHMEDDIVISDFRYYNEYDKICKAFSESCNIKTYHLKRPGVSSNEESDNQLVNFNFDFNIVNDYPNVAELYRHLSFRF
jgi:hypothetical protein